MTALTPPSRSPRSTQNRTVTPKNVCTSGAERVTPRFTPVSNCTFFPTLNSSPRSVVAMVGACDCAGASDQNSG